MQNVLAATSGFFTEATSENWAKARDAGITDVELCFSREWPVDNIIRNAESMLAMFEHAHIRVSSVHLPFDNSWDISVVNDELCRTGAIVALKQLLDWTAKKGINIAVLHPSFEPIRDEDRPARLFQAIVSIRELSDFAKAEGIRIAVENLPRTCLGNCADDMLLLTNHGRDADVCFDCNHLFKESHREFFEKIGPYVITSHLSDYDRINERHWMVGDGCIDWEELISLYEAAGYQGRYLFETKEDASALRGEVVTPTELVRRFREITKR